MSDGPDYYGEDIWLERPIRVSDLRDEDRAEWSSRDIDGATPEDRERIIWARVWLDPRKARKVVCEAFDAHWRATQDGDALMAGFAVSRFGYSGVKADDLVRVPAHLLPYLDALKALEDSAPRRASEEKLRELFAACRLLRDWGSIGDGWHSETEQAVWAAFKEVE